MTDIHTEEAFEIAIADYLVEHGYAKGDPKLFDRERALFPEDLFAFIEATQGKLWESLSKQTESE